MSDEYVPAIDRAGFFRGLVKGVGVVFLVLAGGALYLAAGARGGNSA